MRDVDPGEDARQLGNARQALVQYLGIEMIKMQDIETAYARMLKSDVKYRFVIDMASLKNS